MSKSFIKIVQIILFLLLANFTVFSQSTSPKYIYLKPQKIKDFVRKLNEFGKLGYKLKLVERNTEFSPLENPDLIEIAGVVELREGDTFEYEWFKSLTLSDFAEQVSPKAELGFYFSNRISYSVWQNVELPAVTAKPGTDERAKQDTARSGAIIKDALSQDPVDGGIFILERKNKQVKPVKFKFATAIPIKTIWGTDFVDNKKIVETTENSINEIDTINYVPVAVFFSSAVFKTRVSHLPTILFQNDLRDYYTEKPVYKVAETFQSRGKRKIDLNTENGFNIEAIHNIFILLRQANRKISYYWLDPKQKDFLPKLSEISNQGWRFVTNGASYTTDSLIFENPLPDDGKRFEYKVISFAEKPQLKGGNIVAQEFNELLNQSYQPRSLFYQNGMNLLFERQK